MVGFAAGMALSKRKPFVYTISNFLTMRAFEQIRNDISLQETDVKIVGIGGGFAYSTLGPTHHATEDISLMRTLPNMTVICPSSPIETHLAVNAIYGITGPVYLRLGTNGEPEIYDGAYDFKIGKGVVLRDGSDLSIIVSGPFAYDVLEAYEMLNKKGITPRIINIHTIKPIDRDLILKAAKETRRILTVENHTVVGGLGSAVAEVIAEEHDEVVLFRRLGLKDKYCMAYGKHLELKKLLNLDAESIAKAAEYMISDLTSTMSRQ